MDGPRIDSRLWTAEIGAPFTPPPSALPPPVHGMSFRSRSEARAVLHILLLMLSPFVWLLARRLVEACTSGLLIAAAPLHVSLALPIPLGLLLLLLTLKTRLPPRLLGTAALAGWIAMLAGAGHYLAGGVSDGAAAHPSLPQRALVEAFQSHSRARPTTLFRLQDGRGLITNGFHPRYGDTSRCYSASLRAGRHGFAWLALVDASPPPGPGQLAWPMDPARCFSATPLADLRG